MRVLQCVFPARVAEYALHNIQAGDSIELGGGRMTENMRMKTEIQVQFLFGSV